MSTESIAPWIGFLASREAPKGAMPPMRFDGFLTGVIVAAEAIEPEELFEGLFNGDVPEFRDEAQVRELARAVARHFDDLASTIDDSYAALNAGEPFAYKPLFLAAVGKPRHDVVRAWVDGFRMGSVLAGGWDLLARNRAVRFLLAPFLGFDESAAEEMFEPGDNIEELLDEFAAAIPRSVVLLRQVGKHPERFLHKIGRNEPCPCGSGRKFKRCCGEG